MTVTEGKAPATTHVGTGLPTCQELLDHYPAKFTWQELKAFVNSGDLGLLKRHKMLQLRYNAWSEEIKKEWGTIENYLLKHRLRWGQPDRLSVLKPYKRSIDEIPIFHDPDSLPIPTVDYFRADTPPHLISIIVNDWPYSVPPDVEHSVVWTRQPIFHFETIPPSVSERIETDGLWGFTGLTSPPPSPSSLPSSLPALAEWDVPTDRTTDRVRGTPEEDVLVRRAGAGVHDFVRSRWPEDGWETAWFVNPPRLQSVRGLAHTHVFARRKS